MSINRIVRLLMYWVAVVWIALKLSWFGYAVDIALYYDFWYGYLIEQMALGLLGLGFLLFLRRVYRNGVFRASFLIALVGSVALGIWTKWNTQGDPIYEYLSDQLYDGEIARLFIVASAGLFMAEHFVFPRLNRNLAERPREDDSVIDDFLMKNP